MTPQHGGILLVVIGTILLAYSVKVKEQKGVAMEYKKDGSSMALVPMCDDEDPDCTYVYPSQTWIDQKMFRAGLFCVALGSAFQW